VIFTVRRPSPGRAGRAVGERRQGSREIVEQVVVGNLTGAGDLSAQDGGRAQQRCGEFWREHP